MPVAAPLAWLAQCVWLATPIAVGLVDHLDAGANPVSLSINAGLYMGLTEFANRSAIPLQVNVYNTKGQRAGVIAEVIRAHQDGMDILIGPGECGQLQLALETGTAIKTSMVQSAVFQPLLASASSFPQLVQAFPSVHRRLTVVLSHAQYLGYRAIAVVSARVHIREAVLDMLPKMLAARNMTLGLSVTFSPTDQNDAYMAFKSLKLSHLRFVLLIAQEAAPVAFAAAAKAKCLRQNLYVYHVFTYEYVLKQGGQETSEFASGVYSADVQTLPQNPEAAEAFKQRYKEVAPTLADNIPFVMPPSLVLAGWGHDLASGIMNGVKLHLDTQQSPKTPTANSQQTPQPGLAASIRTSSTSGMHTTVAFSDNDLARLSLMTWSSTTQSFLLLRTFAFQEEVIDGDWAGWETTLPEERTREDSAFYTGGSSYLPMSCSRRAYRDPVSDECVECPANMLNINEDENYDPGKDGCEVCAYGTEMKGEHCHPCGADETITFVDGVSRCTLAVTQSSTIDLVALGAMGALFFLLLATCCILYFYIVRSSKREADERVAREKQFVGFVFHELRNPLNGLLAHVRFAQDAVKELSAIEQQQAKTLIQQQRLQSEPREPLLLQAKKKTRSKGGLRVDTASARSKKTTLEACAVKRQQYVFPQDQKRDNNNNNNNNHNHNNNNNHGISNININKQPPVPPLEQKKDISSSSSSRSSSNSSSNGCDSDVAEEEAEAEAGPTLEKVNQDLATCMDCCDHAMDVLNNVLDLTRISEGRLKVIVKEVNVRPLLQKVCKMLSAQAKPGVRLYVEDTPDLSSLWIMADARRLAQCLLNLVGNALKFTHRGSIVLHASVTKEATPSAGGKALSKSKKRKQSMGSNIMGSSSKTAEKDQENSCERVLVSVTDTGPGVTAQDRLYIFSDQGSYFGTGSGLGLLLCRRFLEAMGTQLQLDSPVFTDDRSRADVRLELASEAVPSSRAAGHQLATLALPGSPDKPWAGHQLAPVATPPATSDKPWISTFPSDISSGCSRRPSLLEGGYGSSFWFTLPVCKPSVSHNDNDDTELWSGGERRADGTQLRSPSGPAANSSFKTDSPKLHTSSRSRFEKSQGSLSHLVMGSEEEVELKDTSVIRVQTDGTPPSHHHVSFGGGSAASSANNQSPESNYPSGASTPISATSEANSPRAPNHSNNITSTGEGEKQELFMKWRVLLVDDVKLNCKVMQRVLSSGLFKPLKWSFTIASTAEEALAAIGRPNTPKFDLMVIDQHLESAGGVLKGNEAADRLRDSAVRPRLVVGCTGEAGAGDAPDEGLWNSADLLWGKPIPNPGKILQDLERALDKAMNPPPSKVSSTDSDIEGSPSLTLRRVFGRIQWHTAGSSDNEVDSDSPPMARLSRAKRRWKHVYAAEPDPNHKDDSKDFETASHSKNNSKTGSDDEDGVAIHPPPGASTPRESFMTPSFNINNNNISGSINNNNNNNNPRGEPALQNSGSSNTSIKKSSSSISIGSNNETSHSINNTSIKKSSSSRSISIGSNNETSHSINRGVPFQITSDEADDYNNNGSNKYNSNNNNNGSHNSNNTTTPLGSNSSTPRGSSNNLRNLNSNNSNLSNSGRSNNNNSGTPTSGSSSDRDSDRERDTLPSSRTSKASLPMVSLPMQHDAAGGRPPSPSVQHIVQHMVQPFTEQSQSQR
eukprot:g46734.t1